MPVYRLYLDTAEWANSNQGVLSVIIFLVSMFLGWVSGIFSALIMKPKFKIDLIEGPTFCCTFPIGLRHFENEVHRTGFVLYLKISNIGFSPSSICDISIAYHWSLKPFSLLWLRYSIGWFWLHRQSVSIHDFQVEIGENIKFYPFLTQRSVVSGKEQSTYLKVGQEINGVVYFEQEDSWGGCFPAVKGGKVAIKVQVRDAFGRKYSRKCFIPPLSLEEARKFNPSFGTTHAKLRNQKLPFDGFE
ncbi:hypothetical protein [Methylocystis echinoides]|uniref:hypothetical protein n=1 Tax=Methylocystis echinoides TaxID=29468 RepID=UPI00249392E6|nr:hypothetical protein [Methylocystis echinoides]